MKVKISIIYTLFFFTYLNCMSISFNKVKKQKDLVLKHSRIDSLINIAISYQNNIDSCFKYSNKALLLSKQLNYKLGLESAYVRIATAHYNNQNYTKSINFADSCIQMNITKKMHVKGLGIKGLSLIKKKEIIAGIGILDSTYNYARKNKMFYDIGRLLLFEGLAYKDIYDFKTSYLKFESGLIFTKKHNINSLIPYFYYNYGLSLLINNKDRIAIKKFNEGKKEALKQNYLFMFHLCTLGEIEAKLKLNKFNNKAQIDSTLNFFIKSRNTIFMGITHKLMGIYNTKLKKYKKAETYFIQSEKELSIFPKEKIKLYKSVINLFEITNNKEKLKQYISKLEKVSLKLKDYECLSYAYNLFLKLSKNINDKLFIYRKYSNAIDSFNSQMRKNKTKIKIAKLELGYSQINISILEKNKNNAKLKIKLQQNIKFIIIILIIGLTIILSIILPFYFINKKRKKKLIEVDKEGEVFFYILANKIKQPIKKTINLINNYPLDKNSRTKEFDNIIKLINTSTNTYIMLETLLVWSKLKSNLLKLKIEKINISKLFNNSLNDFLFRKKSSNYFKISKIPEIEAQIDGYLIELLFSIMFLLSVKYKSDDSIVEIKITKKSDLVFFNFFIKPHKEVYDLINELSISKEYLHHSSNKSLDFFIISLYVCKHILLYHFGDGMSKTNNKNKTVEIKMYLPINE